MIFEAICWIALLVWGSTFVISVACPRLARRLLGEGRSLFIPPEDI